MAAATHRRVIGGNREASRHAFTLTGFACSPVASAAEHQMSITTMVINCCRQRVIIITIQSKLINSNAGLFHPQLRNGERARHPCIRTFPPSSRDTRLPFERPCIQSCASTLCQAPVAGFLGLTEHSVAVCRGIYPVPISPSHPRYGTLRELSYIPWCTGWCQ